MTKRTNMKAKKKINVEDTGAPDIEFFPKTKTEKLSDEIFDHLLSHRNSGLHCVVDRSMGTHFFEVLKDGLLGYKFDRYICERLYPISKCQTVKYPLYEASDEAISLYNEFMEYSNRELTKEELASEDFITDRGEKLQSYIDRLNTFPPKASEKDQLAYVSGYNDDMGYPVIKLSEIPENVLKSLSYKFAENAMSHFTTINFVNHDSFMLNTEVIMADTEYSDILVRLRYGMGG